jgi:hypothetical protein
MVGTNTAQSGGSAGISGQNDYIMILGKVIEKIGDNVTG